MRRRQYGLLCIALTMVSLSGCAALGQLSDTVWSETRTLGQKTHKQIAQLLRPAPKPVYTFEDTDAALNTALLEQRVFEALGPEVLVEDARTRFVAELPTLRPSPTGLSLPFEDTLDAAGEDDAAVATNSQADRQPVQRSYATLDEITVEVLDPIDVAAKAPASSQMPQGSTSEYDPDDFELAGAPGSLELRL